MYNTRAYVRLILVTLLLLISACSKKNQEAQLIDPVTAKQPTKILYITSVGWFHDYQQQVKTISKSINQFVDADIDVIVGDIEYLKANDFSKGYDLLIYNFCHAAQRDDKLIKKLMSPVVDEGKPLIALHCAMHSFQYSPEWPIFLGLKTLRHEQERSFDVKKVSNHKLTDDMPDTWTLSSDELYITLEQAETTIPLLQSFGVETQKQHTQAWLYQSGKGQVIGTTLGHNESTLTDEKFKQFLVNSIHFLIDTDQLDLTKSTHNMSLNVLTKSVTYPDKAEKQCVIHNMFAIGGEKVKACIAKQCVESSMIAECTAQCQKDNPWPVPESLREACQKNQLTVPNL